MIFGRQSDEQNQKDYEKLKELLAQTVDKRGYEVPLSPFVLLQGNYCSCDIFLDRKQHHKLADAQKCFLQT